MLIVGENVGKNWAIWRKFWKDWYFCFENGVSLGKMGILFGKMGFLGGFWGESVGCWRKFRGKNWGFWKKLGKDWDFLRFWRRNGKC